MTFASHILLAQQGIRASRPATSTNRNGGSRFSRDQFYAPTAILVGVNKIAGHDDIAVDTSGNVFDNNNAAVPVTRTFY